jgi:predicted solute-binding protein
LKLGRIPFINMAPFHHFLGARWLEQHELALGNPRQLGTLARAGKLDAACFSYVDGLELVASGEFEWLDSLGIAGRGPIRSILLVGAEDPKSLAGQAIAVTPQTSTTVKLMEAWLREHVGVTDYRLTGPDDNAAARLLIGDEALRRHLERGGQEPQIDLCEEWERWTARSFVFARWAVRQGLAPRAKAELALTLRSALDLGLEDLAHVAEAQAERTGLPAKAIESYLQGIRFRLGEDELSGASLFESYFERLS